MRATKQAQSAGLAPAGRRSLSEASIRPRRGRPGTGSLWQEQVAARHRARACLPRKERRDPPPITFAARHATDFPLPVPLNSTPVPAATMRNRTGGVCCFSMMDALAVQPKRLRRHLCSKTAPPVSFSPFVGVLEPQCLSLGRGALTCGPAPIGPSARP
jgi:hypothetical protein